MQLKVNVAWQRTNGAGEHVLVGADEALFGSHAVLTVLHFIQLLRNGETYQAESLTCLT